MNMKCCRAVIVEKDIYGSKDIFLEGDIVRIVYGQKEDPRTVTGRILDTIRGGTWEYDSVANDFIKIDTSAQYCQCRDIVKLSEVITIEKIPG